MNNRKDTDIFAIRECLIEERPLTFLGTLEAASLKLSFALNIFKETLKKI